MEAFHAAKRMEAKGTNMYKLGNAVGRLNLPASAKTRLLRQSKHHTVWTDSDDAQIPLAQIMYWAGEPTECSTITAHVTAISTPMGRLWFAVSDDAGKSRTLPAELHVTLGYRGTLTAFATRQCSQCLRHLPKPDSHKCAACRADGYHVRYCGPECQRRHWPLHKQACTSIKRGASAR